MQHFISVCRLSLAWVTSENSTSTGMPTSFDSIFFAGPYLVCYCLRSRPHLSVVPRQLCLLSRLSAVQSPTALVRVTLSTACQLLCPTLFSRSLTTARFQVQESFVWFRAETDKGIVCSGHPYSATSKQWCEKLERE